MYYECQYAKVLKMDYLRANRELVIFDYSNTDKELVDLGGSMALINCSECGREMSDKATVCPACGCPNQIFDPSLPEEYRNALKEVMAASALEASGSAIPIEEAAPKKKTPWVKMFLFILIGGSAILALLNPTPPPSDKKISKEEAAEDDSALTASIAIAIASSEDYSVRKEAFLVASKGLIKNHRCDLSDFKEMGGWMRSTSHKPKPVYFTYCGGMKVRNRIYLNADSGNIFR